ncbi:hypothetical protein PS3A_10150 [Pseudomonas sp. 3A(2025)]
MTSFKTKLTLTHLPKLPPRPEHAADHTGKRRGQMTAIAWSRPSRSGKGTVWLCRCDCGLFEYRRPGTWVSKPFPDDLCHMCQRAKGANARAAAPERLQRWVDGLRSLGLTDTEITHIQSLGMQVETKGKTALEIRGQLGMI